MKSISYTLFFMLILPLGLFGQQRWEWGLFAGGANYLGDLVETQYPFANETGPAAGMFLGYKPGKVWGIRTSVYYSRISGSDQNFGDDRYKVDRNFKFQSQIVEFSLLFRWEPFGKKRYPEGGGFKRIWSPYIFAGGAIAYLEPSADFSGAPRNGLLELIQKDRDASYSKTTLAIPIGGGLMLDISKRSSLAAEFGIRRGYSDYLDGISESANAESNDWYMIGGFTYGLRFGQKDTDEDGIIDKKDDCPKVKGVYTGKGCPDEDGDGVEDLEDLCPNKMGSIEMNGCPDTDGDQIVDIADDCPGIAGSLATNGCPDKDGDEIRDSQDACPERAGPASMQGCPDLDGDGVADKWDDCPDKPGRADRYGCPFIDTDFDGLEDKHDECPDDPGTSEFRGCPDSDGDGVIDQEDKCPELAGSWPNKGCPHITEEEQKILDEATKTVKFETGKAILKVASLKILDRVAELMEKKEIFSLEMSGHTDSQGKDENNQRLSEKRAKACFDYLGSKGVPDDRMIYQGFGETQPIGDNKTSNGRRQNRRVEFTLFLPD